MPRLVVVSRYLKSGSSKKLSNYVKYIATREGAATVKENNGTAPATIPGKILTGLFAGSSAFFIAGPGTSPSGLVFSVLLTNVFSLIIVQSEAHYDRIRMEKLVCRKEASFNAD